MHLKENTRTIEQKHMIYHTDTQTGVCCPATGMTSVYHIQQRISDIKAAAVNQLEVKLDSAPVNTTPIE